MIFLGDDHETTERRQPEHMAQEQLSFLQSILDNIYPFIGVLTPDGTLIEINSAALEATGVDSREVLGKRFWDTVWWEHSEDARNEIRAACERGARGEASRMDLIAQTAQGMRLPIDFMLTAVCDPAGRVTYLIPSAADISEHESTVRELGEARNLLASVIENIPAMVFMKRADDLSFVQLNGAGEKLLGLPRNDVLGKTDYDVFPKEDADFFTAGDRETLTGDEMKEYPERPIQRKGSGTRYLATSKAPLRDTEGRVTHVLGVSVDITARKQLEEELQRVNADLEQCVEERTQALEESEFFNYLLLENLSEGVAVSDADGKLKYFNKVGREWLGNPLAVEQEK
jgi:PAS domain S-box-containing protein